MPDSPELPKSELWELDAAFNEMQDEVALNGLVFNATKKALGEIARRHYPGISNWGPEQLRRLADRIDRAALNYSQDLNELQFISDEEELG